MLYIYCSEDQGRFICRHEIVDVLIPTNVLCWPDSTTRGCCFLISSVFLHKPQSFDKQVFQTYIDTHYPSKVHMQVRWLSTFLMVHRSTEILSACSQWQSLVLISVTMPVLHTHTLMWVFICVFWVPEFGHRAVDYSVTRNTHYRGLARVARDTLNRTEKEGKKQRQRKKNWRKLNKTDHN